MNTLPISIVIPTYNRAAFIARAVESALRAVESGDEIVVVDDGSTDDTATVLARYSERIRFIQATHGGAGASRNRGVSESRNPLIAFLDSDDEWFPDKLRLQRGLIHARPDITFCFSDFQVVDRSGRRRYRYLKNWHQDSRPWDQILSPAQCYSVIATLPPGREDFFVYVGDLYPALMERLYIGTFTLLLRRDLPGGVPAFPMDLPTFEDWQFFGELARRGPGAYLDCETAIQHGHRSPRLTDANALIQAETRLKIVERVWGSDSVFLARRGDAYRKVLAEQQRQRCFFTAKKLLEAGRLHEARAAFRQLGDYPSKYRLLMTFPDVMLHGLVWFAGKVRALMSGH